MPRILSEIKVHPIASALFVLYWLAVYGLYAFRWKAPTGSADLVPPVLALHLLLPFIAGIFVSWWRRRRGGSITGGMLVGATVFAIDFALVLAYPLILDSFWALPTEKVLIGLIVHLMFVTAAGLIGALFGLIGSAGAIAVTSSWQERAAPSVCALDLANQFEEDAVRDPGWIIPRRMLFAAGGLLVGVATTVLLGVIPSVLTDTSPKATPNSAATGFAIVVILNLLIGLALLVPIRWRSVGAGKVLVVTTGSLGLLLGLMLLDGGAAFAGRPGMRAVAIACFGCGAVNLGAGALALAAAFRRSPDQRRRPEE
jgi:hypothetical protein